MKVSVHSNRFGMAIRLALQILVVIGFMAASLLLHFI